MADVTVKQLAQVVGIPVERLLNQLQEAGLSFNDDQQTVNEDQKRILLGHLKGSTTGNTSATPERITLRRKSVSQVTLGHDIHSGKTVNIEVRKKKTFIQRSAVEHPPIEEEVNLLAEKAVEELPIVAVDIAVGTGSLDPASEIMIDAVKESTPDAVADDQIATSEVDLLTIMGTESLSPVPISEGSTPIKDEVKTADKGNKKKHVESKPTETETAEFKKAAAKKKPKYQTFGRE